MSRSLSSSRRAAPDPTPPQLRQHPLPRKAHDERRLHLRIPADRHADRVRVRARLCHRSVPGLDTFPPSTDAKALPSVSAGYDAAQGDELGQMEVTPEGFAHMTHMLSVLANGKLVLALEVCPTILAFSVRKLSIQKTDSPHCDPREATTSTRSPSPPRRASKSSSATSRDTSTSGPRPRPRRTRCRRS